MKGHTGVQNQERESIRETIKKPWQVLKTKFVNVLEKIKEERQTGKVKFANNCIELKDKTLYKDTLRFAYVDTFHIAMEMLLTVYIIEMLVMLTNICPGKSSTVTITPFVIFLPFIIGIPVALGCVIWAMIYFQNKANEYLTGVFANVLKNSSSDEDIIKCEFDKFANNYRKSLIETHLICICLYVIFSFTIAAVLKLATKEFSDGFVLIVTLTGLLLGSFWNVAGYYRHQRILWCRFFPEMKDHKNRVFDKVREKDVIDNCDYHRWSIGSIVASMVVLLILFAVVVINFHSDGESISIIKLLGEGYGTLIIPFFTLCIIYVKLCYSISFDHNDDTSICPSLAAALCEHPNTILKELKKDSVAKQGVLEKRDAIVLRIDKTVKEVESIKEIIKSFGKEENEKAQGSGTSDD